MYIILYILGFSCILCDTYIYYRRVVNIIHHFRIFMPACGKQCILCNTPYLSVLRAYKGINQIIHVFCVYYMIRRVNIVSCGIMRTGREYVYYMIHILCKLCILYDTLFI